MLVCKSSADVNQQNQYGNNALMIAAKNGHLEVLLCLMFLGANLNHLSKNDTTELINNIENEDIKKQLGDLVKPENIKGFLKEGDPYILLDDIESIINDQK